LVQCADSAASTFGVFFGQGPSSKVRTISPGRRKSWLLKCSKPKPGPPVVSICTTRVMPSASGLPAQTTGGAGGAAAGGAPAAAGVVVCGTGAAAAASRAGETSVTTAAGAFGAGG